MTESNVMEPAAEPPGGLESRFGEVMDAAPVMIWVSGRNKGCVWSIGRG
jgi:hypothetical protein